MSVSLVVTHVPAVTDALIEALRNAAATLQEPTTVYDTAAEADTIATDFLVVGGNYRDKQAVVGTRTSEGLGGDYDEEIFQIRFLADALRPDGEAKAARDRVAELVALIEQTLVTDRQLSGTCGFARVGPDIAWDAQRVIVGAQDGYGIEVTASGAVEVRVLL